MKIRSQSAFTLIEMLVVISIIAVLAAFAVPALTSALNKGQMTGTMNNGRQLYLAGQQMALDGSANSDPNLGWPADVGDTTLQDYMQRLIRNDYLKPGDVAKLLSGPGASCTATFTGTGLTGTLQLGGTKAALKVYPVAEANASNAVFCVSANYVYGTDLAAANAGVPNNPFGDKGFVVQRKGGDASILRKTDAKPASGSAADIATFESKVGVKPDGTSSAGDPAAPAAVLTYP
jgi:prepilin-type N-terminal cleavage/methylation domain-containing protein